APFPLDLRAPLRLLRALGPDGAVRALRAALGSTDGLAGRLLATRRGRALLAGNAAHSMLPLERRPSAGFALALLVLGHAVGWPFPRGGSQALADALAARLRAAGGEIRTSSSVDELPQADVVLCDVSPPELVRLARGRLPGRYASALRRFRYGPGAFKLDWALAAPIPWRDERCARAATVHLGGSLEEIAASPRRPSRCAISGSSRRAPRGDPGARPLHQRVTPWSRLRYCPGCGSEDVSTTSKSAPLIRPIVWRSSFDQCRLGAPETYQLEP